MKEKKGLIVVRQTATNPNAYRVERLRNRTVPRIGTELKKDEVDKLIRELENTDVEVLPNKLPRF